MRRAGRRQQVQRQRRQRLGQDGLHPAQVEPMGRAAIDADVGDAGMLAEEPLEVIGDDRLEVDRGIETAGTHRRLAHVPQRDTARAQALGPLVVGNAGPGTEQLAHDPPEGVLGLRVILVRRQRRLAGQRTEDRRTRASAQHGREPAGLGEASRDRTAVSRRGKLKAARMTAPCARRGRRCVLRREQLVDQAQVALCRFEIARRLPARRLEIPLCLHVVAPLHRRLAQPVVRLGHVRLLQEALQGLGVKRLAGLHRAETGPRAIARSHADGLTQVPLGSRQVTGEIASCPRFVSTVAARGSASSARS